MENEIQAGSPSNRASNKKLIWHIVWAAGVGLLFVYFLIILIRSIIFYNQIISRADSFDLIDTLNVLLPLLYNLLIFAVYISFAVLIIMRLKNLSLGTALKIENHKSPDKEAVKKKFIWHIVWAAGVALIFVCSIVYFIIGIISNAKFMDDFTEIFADAYGQLYVLWLLVLYPLMNYILTLTIFASFFALIIPRITKISKDLKSSPIQ